MSITTRRARTRLGRRLSWLAVGALLATAILAPAGAANAASFNGAIWTSLANGETVNANIYDAKDDVYLNGGPQNCGNGNGLPDGLYYFQVTNPSGATLLSSDAIKFRMVEVVDGVIAGVGGTGNHDEGSSGCNGGLPVQLMPYDDTPNNGNEYSVDLAPQAAVEACEGFDADSEDFNFLDCAESKNDNYKVGDVEPTPTPTPTATPTATPTPTPTPSPTPTATPGVGQFEFPTIGLTDCEEPGGSGSIIVSGFAATNGGELVLNPGEGEIVITDNGTYPLEPGTYTAIVRFEGETVAGPTEFTIEACPGEPTPTPTTAPTETPTGEVNPATGTPGSTLPPTDALTGTGGGDAGDGWRVALLAIAGLLAGALLLTPARAVIRREDSSTD